MIRETYLKYLMLTVLIAVVVGCSSGVELEKAGGQVLIDGKPASDGSIQFYPVGGGRSASATIQEDGAFTISYRAIGDGLPKGEYLVSINVTKFIPDKVQPKLPKGFDDAVPLEPVGKTISLVPAIYTQYTSTPLRQMVTDDGEPQHFVFDVPTKSE